MSESARMAAPARRQQLLEVALELFARQSFEATTTREIARAAGVSDALLYRYFPSKQALYDELADICTRGGAHGAEQLLAAPPSTARLVQAVHFLLYNVLIGSPAGRLFKSHLDRLLAQSLSGNGKLLARFHSTTMAPWLTAMEGLLRFAEQAGDLHAGEDPQLTVWFTYQLGLAAGLLENCPAQPVAYQARGLALLDSLVRFALRGLGLTDTAMKRYYRPGALLAETQRLFAKESIHEQSRT